MNEQSTFGARFKAFRKLQKLSGEEIGLIMGVGRGQISYIENDKALPTLEGIIRLKKEFPDLNIDWLSVGEGQMSNAWVKPGPNASACWDELEKEKTRYETLLQDYRELQIKVKIQETENT